MGVEGCPRRPRGLWVSSLLLEEQGLQLVDLLLHFGELLLSSVLRVANCSESRAVGVVFVHFFLKLLPPGAAWSGPGSRSPSSPMATRYSPPRFTIIALPRLCLRSEVARLSAPTSNVFTFLFSFFTTELNW